MDRMTRYFGLVRMDEVNSYTHAVIGLGAVGRPLALTLAAMGVAKVVIYDFDTVEVHNLGAQGYAPDDIGQAKADVVARDMLRMNPDMEVVIGSPRRWSRAADPCDGDVVYCCADSMAVRRDAAQCGHARLIVTGGIARWEYDVFGFRPDHAQWYLDNHWTDDDSVEPLPCTERSTIMLAQKCASDMVTLAVAHLSGDVDVPVAAHSHGLAFRQWQSRGDTR